VIIPSAKIAKVKEFACVGVFILFLFFQLVLRFNLYCFKKDFLILNDFAFFEFFEFSSAKWAFIGNFSPFVDAREAKVVFTLDYTKYVIFW
jgi:hypothetical protein